MSFILDVLKKAEEERKKLEARIPFSGRVSEKKRRTLSLSIFLLLFLGLAALFLLHKGLSTIEKTRIEETREIRTIPEVAKAPNTSPKVEIEKVEKKEIPAQKIEPEKREIAKTKPIKTSPKSKKPPSRMVPKTEKAEALVPQSAESSSLDTARKLNVERIDMERLNTLFAEAQILAEKGKLEEAKRIYYEILAQKQDHVEALNNLGLIYLKEGRKKEALSLFGRSLSFKADYPKAYNNIGIVLAQEGEKKLAEEYFKKAIELGGGIEPYINLSHLLRSEKKYAEAERVLLPLIEKGVRDPNLYLALALIKDERGEHKEAIRYYRAYLREGESKEQKRAVIERLNYLERVSGNN
ncbi:MAG: tetratricopeptide repeat protein [Desulfobacterota bacterium]|nr:tetratricopeptide repeat protein [Thermodesulfobacteriota bacterium]MDW8001581.1 tetratricopeptide repeat protein [Deltaproteobacteria bacterium]